MIEQQKAIYVGAGFDVFPLLCFKNIKEWVYIDSLPNNEYGPNYSKQTYDKGFLNDLKNMFKMYEYQFINKNRNILKFFNFNTKQNITYLINTYIPNKLDFAEKYINNWDTLIVAGHDPNFKIINYRNPNCKSTFIGFSGTYYGNEELENNSIITKLHQKKINFNNYIFNVTKNWWSLYCQLENEFGEESDKLYDFLPGLIDNLNHRIIKNIYDYYESLNLILNNKKTEKWNDYIEIYLKDN